MSFRRIVKDSLISLAVLGMIDGSLNSNVANAKHRRYHYRYTRRIKRAKRYRRHDRLYRHHHNIRYRYRHNYHEKKRTKHYVRKYKHNYASKHRKHTTRKHHTRKFKANNNIQSHYHKHYTLTAKQVRQQAHDQMIKDINQDREKYGISPVADSPIMDEIANLRAKQALGNFTHYDTAHNNTPYELEDAKKLGIQFGKGAERHRNGSISWYTFTENLAGSALDIQIEESAGGAPSCYNHNGIQMANNTNKDLMYYDGDSDWGHRKNILYKPWKYVGVGVANKGINYVIAEDFASWARQGNNVEGDPNAEPTFHHNSNRHSNDYNYSDNSNDNNNTNDNGDGDDESQSQSSYNYNNNNNGSSSSSISESESNDNGSENININNNNNTTSSNSDNNSYSNPLAGKTIHKNGITVTYTKDGMIAHDNHGDTDSASGPNSTINIDGQTFTN